MTIPNVACWVIYNGSHKMVVCSPATLQNTLLLTLVELQCKTLNRLQRRSLIVLSVSHDSYHTLPLTLKPDRYRYIVMGVLCSPKLQILPCPGYGWSVLPNDYSWCYYRFFGNTRLLDCHDTRWCIGLETSWCVMVTSSDPLTLERVVQSPMLQRLWRATVTVQ
jgi:hypothetical protein